MGIYSEEKIFSDLYWYRTSFEFAEKQSKRLRRIHRTTFKTKRHKGFKHKDPFLYNCPKCGMSSHNNNNFCTNCGTKLNNNDTYEDIINIYNEYSNEPTIKAISKDYVISMKNDYYFMNRCDGILEALFYVVTSSRFDKEKAKMFLERIKSFKTLTQRLILQDFKNKLLYHYNEIYGYISNWNGYKTIMDDNLSEVDILGNICEIMDRYTPPSYKTNEIIYDMGIKHSNRELPIGDYFTASKLIVGEAINRKNPYDRFEFVDDVLCRKLLGIASSWYYVRINKCRMINPNKMIFWEFVWSCQLNPSDELKLYRIVDCLVTE